MQRNMLRYSLIIVGRTLKLKIKKPYRKFFLTLCTPESICFHAIGLNDDNQMQVMDDYFEIEYQYSDGNRQ